MRWIVVFLAAISLAAGLVERKSTDGVVLPEVAKLDFKSPPLPFIGSAIGNEPEKFTPRILNTVKSSAVLQKKTNAHVDSDWFAIGISGADIAAITLKEGRVFKIQLFFSKLADARQKDIESKVKKSSNKIVDAKIDYIGGETGSISESVTFSANPAEWYLASHQVSPEIAAAMRAGKLIQDMTDEQADIIGEGPGNYIVVCSPPSGPIRGGATAIDAGPNETIGDPLGINLRRFVVRATGKSDAEKIAKDKGWDVSRVKKTSDPSDVPQEIPKH